MPPLNLNETDDIARKLSDLESDYSQGDLTKKGYCKKKWELLKGIATNSQIKEVEKLQCRLQIDLEEDVYFEKILEIIKAVASSKGIPDEAKTNGDYDSDADEDSKDETHKTDKSKPVENNDDDDDDGSPSPEIKVKDEDGSKTNVDDNDDSNIKLETSSKSKEPASSEAKEIAKEVDNESSKKSEDKTEKNVKTSSRGRKTTLKRSMKEEALTDEEEEVEELLHDRDSSPEWNPSKSNGMPTVKPTSKSRFSLSTKRTKVQEIKPFELLGKEVKTEESSRSAGDSGVEDGSQSAEEDDEGPKKKKSKSNKTTDSSKATIAGLKTSKKTVSRCETCHQILDDDDLKLYQGHPHNAVEEFVALTDPKLSLFTGEENDVLIDDQRPTNKITHFSVYDKEGHLCPIDSGLIERNVLLYFSGYLKPVYEDDTTPEGGVPTKDIGPINEWWVSGYDGGEKALIGFSTAFAEYYLMEPSDEYAPLMNGIKEKIYMGKLVIEFLIDEVNPSYEDLINKIQTSLPPPGMERLTEDSLLKHSQFVCDQVVSFDAASDHVDDTPLIATQCMRALVHYAGITFGKRQVMRREEKKQFKDKKKVEWTKATTTPLVKNIFETFFTEQLDENDVNLTMRRKRCGVCEVCQLPDCGTCPNCLNMVKFGGNGKSKQACIKRKCPNMAVADADDSDPEDEEAYQEAAELKGKNGLVFMRSRQCASGKKPVTWIGEPVVDDGKRVFYEKAMVGEMEIKRGDYVSVEPATLTSPVVIGQVAAMWQNQLGQRFMHAIWFCRSSETVLGETGDSHELFVVDECENSLLSGITAKVQVHYKPTSPTWKTDGGVKVENETLPENTFFYRLRYNEQFGRFEEVQPDPPCRNKATEHRFCVSCERQYLAQKFETPMVDEKLDEVGPKNEIMFGVVKWKGDEYRPGTCVYLEPTTFKFNTYGLVFTPANRKSDTVDEDLYPEFYRKGSEYVKGSNEETPTPFCVGLITAIVTNSKDKIIAPSDICIKVVKFYRPENTVGITTQYHQLDLNLLYSSDEEKIVNFHDVTGKCTIVYRENLLEDVYSWTRAGPHRFYFTEAYDKQSKQTVEPTKLVKQLGDMGKGGGKGKGKGKQVEKRRAEPPPEWNKVSQPLRCLDVFAGCGGLSEGLHQANIAETLWAIEKEEPAANAFKMNNPKATVFTEDCNALLKLVLNGDSKTEKGQKLPQKGEVEMLVGGPPCQGFSGMNRFNSRQYSLFKNSLIVSYLSYCDYYRPRFFILENVRNFVSFKSSMVLKLTLHTLIKMGYQVTFGVLQAGNYGVPQTRRRAIIMAAAPGEILPNFPEPSHVFNLRACQLSVMVGDKKFISNCQWLNSAPYRTITVRDAMSDLPEIKNGANKEEISYNGDPLSHFQKMMRLGQDGVMLRDHICKEMAPIVEARMAHIPTASGSDWRDLPNICVKLSDNNYTKKLQYPHHDKKNGKSSTGALRGVCACASGKACDPMDRQFNTLIPWCLPHTGNRHNHWAGLYGRLEWEGFFSTTVTNPEPMGKQGRVLHPEQTRVVSVRECARSQGFPDKYRFYGTILHKHRQIGNAVPPPMGAAIGREIARSVSQYEKKQLEESTKTELKEEIKQEIKTEPMNTD